MCRCAMRLSWDLVRRVLHVDYGLWLMALWLLANILVCVLLLVEWQAQNTLVKIYFNGILGIRIIPHLYPFA